MKIKGLVGLIGAIPKPWMIIAAIAFAATIAAVSGYFTYQYAYNKQQVKIDEIVNKQQKERAEWNEKLAATSIQAWRDLEDWKLKQKQIFVTRSEIITKWKTKYVSEPNCGLSKSATNALRELWSVQK